MAATKDKLDIQGMNTAQQEELLTLLWDSMKRDPEHHDRVRTGWGTKTREGLLRSIARIMEADNASND